jgi:hypothetical protein
MEGMERKKGCPGACGLASRVMAVRWIVFSGMSLAGACLAGGVWNSGGDVRVSARWAREYVFTAGR